MHGFFSLNRDFIKILLYDDLFPDRPFLLFSINYHLLHPSGNIARRRAPRHHFFIIILLRKISPLKEVMGSRRLFTASLGIGLSFHGSLSPPSPF